MQAASPRLRPMGIGDILDTVFRLYRQNFITFIGIVALLQVPVMLLQIILTMVFGQHVATDMMSLMNAAPAFDPRFDSFADLPIANLVAFFGLTILLALIQGIFVQQIVNGALAYAVSQRYLQRPISILGAYNFGIDRMFNLILAGVLIFFISSFVAAVPIGLLVVLAVAAGAMGEGGEASGAAAALFLIFLFLAAFLLMFLIIMALVVIFMFVTQAIVLEGQNALAALGRSWQLVRGSFWRVLGIYLLLTLLVVVLTAIPSSILNNAIVLIFNDPIADFAIQQALSQLVTYLSQILILPISLLAFTLLYYDVRVRKEGYDMELMAQQFNVPLAAPTEAAAAFAEPPDKPSAEPPTTPME